MSKLTKKYDYIFVFTIFKFLKKFEEFMTLTKVKVNCRVKNGDKLIMI